MVVTNVLQSVSFEKYYIRIRVISGRLGKKLSYTTRCFQGSDVVGEQKSGLGRVRGLLFGVGSGLGINISGTSPSGFRGFLR